jgi:multiple sugar transport system ATP-binding protein
VAGVELLNLSKRYGAAAVIENLSLSIGENELVAFLGPSGCGKTTLLRLIAGLETLDAGEIHIGGLRVMAWRPANAGWPWCFSITRSIRT